MEELVQRNAVSGLKLVCVFTRNGSRWEMFTGVGPQGYHFQVNADWSLSFCHSPIQNVLLTDNVAPSVWFLPILYSTPKTKKIIELSPIPVAACGQPLCIRPYLTRFMLSCQSESGLSLLLNLCHHPLFVCVNTLNLLLGLLGYSPVYARHCPNFTLYLTVLQACVFVVTPPPSLSAGVGGATGPQSRDGWMI